MVVNIVDMEEDHRIVDGLSDECAMVYIARVTGRAATSSEVCCGVCGLDMMISRQGKVRVIRADEEGCPQFHQNASEVEQTVTELIGEMEPSAVHPTRNYKI